MKSKLRILIIFGVLAALFVSSITAAFAYADVTSVVLTCNSLSISGTSDAPYATIYAYNYDTGLEYFVVVPVSGGTYSGTVSFPTVPSGTEFNVEAWGSLTMYTKS